MGYGYIRNVGLLDTSATLKKIYERVILDVAISLRTTFGFIAVEKLLILKKS